MRTSTMEQPTRADGTAEADPFDLNIEVIESGGEAATLMNLTDDGCGSTCPKACATNMG